jgi:hypothetical protein
MTIIVLPVGYAALLAARGLTLSAARAHPAESPGVRELTPPTPAPRQLDRTDTQSLHEGISLAADYLVSACRPDGQFVYRINLDSQIEPQPRYNVLRHAGTMYALALHYELCPRDDTRDALIRAGRYLQDQFLAPVPGHADMLAIWSPPQAEHGLGPLQAKLGGTGLGLVALLSLERLESGFTSRADLRRLGRFLLYMQKPDGSFYSKYIPSQRGRQDEWTSLYYPGEAALGLLMLYEYDPSAEWLHAAANAIGHLARSRAGASEVPADHWALLATERLLPLHDRCVATVPREAILGHAVQVSRSMLREQACVAALDCARLDGCFSADGRTTPTATRLEGLLAALTYLPDQQEPLRALMASSVHRGVRFLLRAQVREGEFAGGFPRSIARLPADAPGTGAHDPRATEIRIDYVQHALSALIRYAAMFGDESTQARCATEASASL